MARTRGLTPLAFVLLGALVRSHPAPNPRRPPRWEHRAAARHGSALCASPGGASEERGTNGIGPAGRRSSLCVPAAPCQGGGRPASARRWGGSVQRAPSRAPAVGRIGGASRPRPRFLRAHSGRRARAPRACAVLCRCCGGWHAPTKRRGARRRRWIPRSVSTLAPPTRASACTRTAR
jgi:hypothetical protein